MRGGIKVMKKLFLIFLLFMPPLCYADGGIVIGSSNQLTEKILPLDYKLMDKMYKEIVVDADCYSKESIFEPFIDGDITIPFSGQDLLQLCREKTHAKDILDGKRDCKKSCSHFVLNYVQEIAKKTNLENVDAGEKNLYFDATVLSSVINTASSGRDWFFLAGVEPCIKGKYLNRELAEPFSAQKLRNMCLLCTDRDTSETLCINFALKYEQLFMQLMPNN